MQCNLNIQKKFERYSNSHEYPEGEENHNYNPAVTVNNGDINAGDSPQIQNHGKWLVVQCRKRNRILKTIIGR